jgi:ComF family protein
MISIEKLKDNLLDILFPQICIGCQKYIEKIPDKKAMVCSDCLEELKPRISCIKLNEKVSLISLSSYSNPVIRSLIHALKYKGVTKTVLLIENLIKNSLNTLINLGIQENDFITPIPLYPKRRSQRGFNQSELIAKSLSSQIGIPSIDTLTRIVNTDHQTNIKDYSKREKNMKGAFKTIDSSPIQGSNILLLDDVFTSGSTTKEAARELLSSGAYKINIFAIAKTD